MAHFVLKFTRCVSNSFSEPPKNSFGCSALDISKSERKSCERKKKVSNFSEVRDSDIAERPFSPLYDNWLSFCVYDFIYCPAEDSEEDSPPQSPLKDNPAAIPKSIHLPSQVELQDNPKTGKIVKTLEKAKNILQPCFKQVNIFKRKSKKKTKQDAKASIAMKDIILGKIKEI